MKFEGFKTLKCSLLAPSNIDDPIFELASCNKTPAKYPPSIKFMQSYPHYPPTNLNKLPFVFLLKMNVINQSKIHY